MMLKNLFFFMSFSLSYSYSCRVLQNWYIQFCTIIVGVFFKGIKKAESTSLFSQNAEAAKYAGKISNNYCLNKKIFFEYREKVV